MTTTPATMNGIDTAALDEIAGRVAADPREGLVRFEVSTAWSGGTRSETRVAAWELGGKRMPRDFAVGSDEPLELLGTNTAPNPQELLMAALNACMTVGYVAGCSVQGIELRSLRLQTSGELDLRGFLGLDPGVPPGYASLRTVVRIDADAPPERLREIHETVLRTSPNRWNLGQPVRMESELVIG